jgi:hypothetical protein
MPKTVLPAREVERYNHKPVIDLVALKSEALECGSACLPACLPAGYQAGH